MDRLKRLEGQGYIFRNIPGRDVIAVFKYEGDVARKIGEMNGLEIMLSGPNPNEILAAMETDKSKWVSDG